MSTQEILEAGGRREDRRFDIRFPSSNGAKFDQDEEWCEVRLEDSWRRIRFHDYDEVYSIPGLYEQIFYDELKCDSPRTVIVDARGFQRVGFPVDQLTPERLAKDVRTLLAESRAGPPPG